MNTLIHLATILCIVILIRIAIKAIIGAIAIYKGIKEYKDIWSDTDKTQRYEMPQTLETLEFAAFLVNAAFLKMDLAGIEPASESLFPAVSPITVADL